MENLEAMIMKAIAADLKKSNHPVADFIERSDLTTKRSQYRQLSERLPLFKNSLDTIYIYHLFKKQLYSEILEIVNPEYEMTLGQVKWKQSKRFYNSMQSLSKLKFVSRYHIINWLYNKVRPKSEKTFDYRFIDDMLKLRYKYESSYLLNKVAALNRDHYLIKINNDMGPDNLYIKSIESNKNFLSFIFPNKLNIHTFTQLINFARDNCNDEEKKYLFQENFFSLNQFDIYNLLKTYCTKQDSLKKIITEFNNNYDKEIEFQLTSNILYKIIDIELGQNIRRTNHNIEDAFNDYLEKNNMTIEKINRLKNKYYPLNDNIVNFQQKSNSA